MNDEKDIIEFLVEGGKASPGPTTAPKLSTYKLNVGEVFSKINQLTKEFVGMEVPVRIIIDKQTKKYEIEIGLPSTSSLLKKEAKIDVAKITKEEAEKGKKYVANIPFESVLKVTKIKEKELEGNSIKSKIKQVLGTCVSLHFTVDNKDPREIIKYVDEGKYDEIINKYFSKA
ncbi:MAG: 50S ribosomal protein L11 [Candidatus Aenigmatarchaeota archaeon]